MITVLEILRQASNLIADEDNWCIYANATNFRGETRMVHEKDAVKFDANGAIKCVVYAQCKTTIASIIFECNQELEQHTSGLKLSYFNDTHTHAEVLQVFKAAITRLSFTQGNCQQQSHRSKRAA